MRRVLIAIGIGAVLVVAWIADRIFDLNLVTLFGALTTVALLGVTYLYTVATERLVGAQERAGREIRTRSAHREFHELLEPFTLGTFPVREYFEVVENTPVNEAELDRVLADLKNQAGEIAKTGQRMSALVPDVSQQRRQDLVMLTRDTARAARVMTWLRRLAQAERSRASNAGVPFDRDKVAASWEEWDGRIDESPAVEPPRWADLKSGKYRRDLSDRFLLLMVKILEDAVVP